MRERLLTVRSVDYDVTLRSVDRDVNLTSYTGPPTSAGLYVSMRPRKSHHQIPNMRCACSFVDVCSLPSPSLRDVQ